MASLATQQNAHYVDLLGKNEIAQYLRKRGWKFISATNIYDRINHLQHALGYFRYCSANLIWNTSRGKVRPCGWIKEPFMRIYSIEEAYLEERGKI